MIAARAQKFDRDFGLRDLLSAGRLAELEQALRTLLGADARLLDERGNPVSGGGDGVARRRVPLRVELEPVGYVEADADEPRLRAAAALVEQLLRSAARYRMASALHLESVEADYERLQQQHEALKQSETRYRELAENLEQRVREQVRTIETAQRQLYQSEKLASVGQLAAGVAHEINNPIGFITSNLGTAQLYVQRLTTFGQRLRGEGDTGAPAAAWRQDRLDEMLEDFSSLLHESLDGAGRVARIVADLKGFSHVDREAEEVCDLNRVIEAVCNVAAGQIRRHAGVTLEPGTLPLTRCRPGHMAQVFLNLLLNAAQAMTQRPGEIRLTTSAGAGEIVVHVADTGCGIPEAQLTRIFEPFFTTREVGQGTGLGLTVCRDIVQAHGGRIEVASRVGAGTTFTIHLPVRD